MKPKLYMRCHSAGLTGSSLHELGRRVTAVRVLRGGEDMKSLRVLLTAEYASCLATRSEECCVSIEVFSRMGEA
jgi:hypothetical protein